MQCHERLRFNNEGKPMFYVFSTCDDWIRTVPSLPYSMTKPEDIDSAAEDHIYDEWRYLCMARPITPKRETPVKGKTYDPFVRRGEEDDE